MMRATMFVTVMMLGLTVCFSSAAMAADVGSFFSNPEFGLPPVLQAVKFGMTDDEVKQAVPDFKSDYYFQVKGNEGIRVEKDMSGDVLSSLRIKFAPGDLDVAAFFQEKWGEAIVEQTALGEMVYHWLDRDTGIRAKLEKQWDDMVVTYSAYIPFETLFPDNVPTLPIPLDGIMVGMPLAQACEIIPAFQNSRWIDLKGYADVRIWYLARQKDSTIKYFTVSFPKLENVHDLLIAKWGAPAKNDSGKEYWKNDALEYLDQEGKLQKGIFVVYQAETSGNDSIDFTQELSGYEYE